MTETRHPCSGSGCSIYLAGLSQPIYTTESILAIHERLIRPNLAERTQRGMLRIDVLLPVLCQDCHASIYFYYACTFERRMCVRMGSHAWDHLGLSRPRWSRCRIES